MKYAIATLAVLLSGLTASAQTTTTVHYPVPVSVTINATCANFGKGLTLTLTGNWETMFWTSIVGGQESSFFLYAGKTLKGRASNGHWYYADGSFENSVTNFVPLTGDGVYVTTTNLQVVGSWDYQDKERFLFHLKQRFTVSNNGNNLTTQPDEVACK